MAELVLNGTKTSLTSAQGRDFVADCVRAGEGLISDTDLRDKYEIDATDWGSITKNKLLIQAIRAESERRVRNGQAAQEAASKHFAKAPGYLNEIMADKATSPRYRIESARELRATAIGNGPETSNNADKFVITINLGGGHVERYEKDLKPIKELTAEEVNWGWRDHE
jgi:hypothetical protein